MTEQPAGIVAGQTRSTRRRASGGLGLMAGLAFAAAEGLYLTALRAQGGSPDPYVPLAVELLLGGLALLAVMGGLLPDRRVRLLCLSATALAGFGLGVLAIFSIGSLVLLGAALSFVAYTMTAPGGSVLSGMVATVTGAFAGLAAVGAVFVPELTPHVTCLSGGAMYTSGISLGGSNGSSSGGMSSGGTSGTVTGGGVDNGRSYHFTCRNGRLVEFTQSK